MLSLTPHLAPHNREQCSPVQQKGYRFGNHNRRHNGPPKLLQMWALVSLPSTVKRLPNAEKPTSALPAVEILAQKAPLQLNVRMTLWGGCCAPSRRLNDRLVCDRWCLKLPEQTFRQLQDRGQAEPLQSGEPLQPARFSFHRRVRPSES